MTRPAAVLTALPSVTLNYGNTVGKYVCPESYKCRPRFVRPTPYRVGAVNRVSFRGDYLYQGNLIVTEPPWDDIINEARNNASWSIQGDMYNHVYSRFIGKMRGDAGEMGAALIEYQKTADFVRDRSETMWDYVTNVDTTRRIPAREKLLSYQSRRWKRPEVLDRLKRAAFRERWAVPRWLGTRWLEAWMVIAPTIGDVNTSFQALGRDIPLGRVKASSKWNTYESLQRVVSSTTRHEKAFARSKWLSISADVMVRNPNLYLLQTLGLLNPLVIAGQVTPWSWMVGWFVNWEQVLNSHTDFAGVQVSSPCISWTHRIVGSDDYYSANQFRGTAYNWGKAYGRRVLTSIPLPSLSVRLPNTLSITRAATSISLIVNKLTNR